MKAPLFLASKWLHFDLLVDTSTMKELFSTLGKPLFQVSTLGVAKKGTSQIDEKTFLEVWQRYLDVLKRGESPNDAEFRFFFTSSFTRDLKALFFLDVGSDREIVSPIEPLLQMQIHRFHYSKEDAKFHPMSFGEKSISWGVRISYPQLFQYPDTRVVEDATKSQFINADLLIQLKNWIRRYTQPTPFIARGKKIYEPMRIDKECLSWIDCHAHLRREGLQIACCSTKSLEKEKSP